MARSRYIIVINANVVAQANTLSKQVDDEGGDKAFTVGLVPAGSPLGTTPIAYWCSWFLTDNQKAAIDSRFGGGGSRGRIFDGDVSTPEDVLQSLGLERAIPDVPIYRGS